MSSLVFRRGSPGPLQCREATATWGGAASWRGERQRDVTEAWSTWEIGQVGHASSTPSDTSEEFESSAVTSQWRANRTVVFTKERHKPSFTAVSCPVMPRAAAGGNTIFSFYFPNTPAGCKRRSKNNKKHFQRKQGERRLPLKVPAHHEVNAGRKCHLKLPLPACAIINTRQDQKERASLWRERLRPLLEQLVMGINLQFTQQVLLYCSN